MSKYRLPIIMKELKFGDSIVRKKKIDFIKSKVVELNNISSSIIEIGVYKGGTAKIIIENLYETCNLYLFDTFEGIPNKSECDNTHIVGDFNDSSYENIIELFKCYKNVYIYKGIFPDETSKFVENVMFKIVHLDVDTYISYKKSLEFLYDRVIKGGFIIFDDYNEKTCQGATIAINEFFKNKKEKIILYDKSYYIIKQ
jgi:O-methyltransferase